MSSEFTDVKEMILTFTKRSIWLMKLIIC